VNRKKSMTANLGIAGVLLFVATTIVAGFLYPGYSHVKQLISESYAIGTPYGVSLRYLGFLPSGILIFLFSCLAIKELPSSTLTRAGFWSIGICYGFATVVVSIFPCDEGCNPEMLNPGIAQVIHNFTGMLTYLFVPFAVLLLGITSLKWPHGKFIGIAGLLCGSISIIFVGRLSADLNGPLAGLNQRIAEGAILSWIICCAVYLRQKEEK